MPENNKMSKFLRVNEWMNSFWKLHSFIPYYWVVTDSEFKVCSKCLWCKRINLLVSLILCWKPQWNYWDFDNNSKDQDSLPIKIIYSKIFTSIPVFSYLLHSSKKHRASQVLLHLFRSWALSSISCHWDPICHCSCLADLQLFLGLPCFLYPYEFQKRAYLVTLLCSFLNVANLHYCDIKLHDCVFSSRDLHY